MFIKISHINYKESYKSFIDTLDREQGFEVFFELLARVLSVFIFPLLYLILAFVNIFIKVKIGFLFNRRLGHLALNTDLFLRRRQLGIIPSNTYFLFFSYRPANKQLVKMFGRNINIINSEFLTKLVAPIGFFATRFWQPLPFNSNEYLEFTKADRTLFFTDNEEVLGKKELKKMGLKKDDWFVCIFARDDEYTSIKFSTTNNARANHRNSDIDSYTDAIKYIIDKGGFVIRTGYKVAKEIEYKHKNMIDYAVHYRSDFMDVYLAANCKFYIGTSAGGSDMAHIFDTPFVGINYMPIGYAPFGKNEIYIPKNVYYKNTCKQVSFERQINLLGNLKVSLGDCPKEIMDKMGINLINNTPEQILSVTQEMFLRLNGAFENNVEYKNKLLIFNNILNNSTSLGKKIKHRVGSDFLIRMKLNE